MKASETRLAVVAMISESGQLRWACRSLEGHYCSRLDSIGHQRRRFARAANKMPSRIWLHDYRYFYVEIEKIF